MRTQLLESRAMLRCLSEVLLYADDEDAVMHADVAQVSGVDPLRRPDETDGGGIRKFPRKRRT